MELPLGFSTHRIGVPTTIIVPLFEKKSRAFFSSRRKKSKFYNLFKSGVRRAAAVMPYTAPAGPYVGAKRQRVPGVLGGFLFGSACVST